MLPVLWNERKPRMGAWNSRGTGLHDTIPPVIYLDAAATSWPKPEAVYRAMDLFARGEAANPGKGGHLMSRRDARS